MGTFLSSTLGDTFTELRQSASNSLTDFPKEAMFPRYINLNLAL
jgi:hypothetical protein